MAFMSVIRRILVNVAATAAASSLLLTGGCVREVSQPEYPDRDGVRAMLSLDVLSGVMPRVQVKSWEDNDDYERNVINLRVYVFSESGVLTGYKLFAAEDLSFSDETSIEGGDVSSSASGIPVSTGRSYIYGIANASTSQYWVTDSKFLNVTDLDNPGFDRDDFLAATVSRQEGAYNPLDNTFLMSGTVNGGSLVTISLKDGSDSEAYISDPVDTESRRLKLYKAVSKSSLTINTADSVRFTPDFIAVSNVPSTFALLPALPSADEPSRPAAASFEDFDRVVLTESSYTMYLPENLQYSASTPSSFNDRERNSWSADGTVKTFENAPSSATYVMVHGRYESPCYVGMVSYTMHLGDFSSDMGDFKVSRNCKYEYTITITGVKNFIAESEKTGDDPGSEGVVINKNAGTLFELDSHYEARVLKVTKSEIKELIAQNSAFSFLVNTWFGETARPLLVTDEGVYYAAEYKDALDHGMTPTVRATLGADGNPSSTDALFGLDNGTKAEPDYDWVHFVLNTGEWTVHGFATGMTRDGSLTAEEIVHGVEDVCKYPGDGNTMNVFQFLERLYVAARDDDYTFFNQGEGDDAYAYVTVFVDESYYPDKSWTQYVNKSSNRIMYLGCDTYQTSSDGKSAYTESKYVLSQKSIWTVYSLDDPSVNAFGTESVSEEEEAGLSYQYLSDTFKNPRADGQNNNQQAWNGRASAVTNQTPRASGGRRDPGWDNYENLTDYGYSVWEYPGHQDLYDHVYKSCASRNRDSNGDGQIQADEIKWYLASADQYLGMFIGEDVLPTGVKIFNPSEANWRAVNDSINAHGGPAGGGEAWLRLWHYFSCSSNNTIWAEEGVSTSGNSNAAKVRCVRTLQSAGDGLADADIYYKALEADSDGCVGVELSLASASYRPYMSSSMSPSYERGDGTTNSPYRRIRVASSNLSGTYRRGQITNANDDASFIPASEDVCNKSMGGAWRVPNMVELALLRSAIGSNFGGIIWSNTSFTALKPGYYRYGRNISNGFKLRTDGNITMAGNNSNTYYVRCVRDVRDGE